MQTGGGAQGAAVRLVHVQYVGAVTHTAGSSMSEMQIHDQAPQRQRVTFDVVLSQLRKRDFAVLSTADAEGNPHAAGVNYGVSRPGRDFALYVMTRRHLKKARNIAQNPH